MGGVGKRSFGFGVFCLTRGPIFGQNNRQDGPENKPTFILGLLSYLKFPRILRRVAFLFLFLNLFFYL